MVSVSRAKALSPYMPQFDGLRTWACGSVMVSHFFPAHAHPVTQWLALGATGVRLFFVLSGFLITGILLRGRDAAEAGTNRGGVLRTFYIRRFLRIFPLFYAVVLVLYVIDYGMMREAILWHVTYLMNFWRVGNDLVFLNHFWSLAVEEHFYLVWPALILWIPRAWLAPAMGLVVLGAQCYRLAAWGLGAEFTHLNVITFANLDTLALGGLLALFSYDPARYGRARAILEKGGLAAGGLMTAALCISCALGVISTTERAVWLSLAEGLLFCCFIGYSARGTFPGGHWLLTPLRYPGKVSYGLYILHPVVWDGLKWLEVRGLPLPQVCWLRFPLFMGIAFGFAILSWHLYELPINRLKRYFSYGNGGEAAA